MSKERTPVSPEAEAAEIYAACDRIDAATLHVARMKPDAEALAAAREAGKREGLEEAAPVIVALSTAIWQMLDDMGARGHHVSGAAKAQARAALDLVASPELEIDYTMEQVRICFKDIGGEPLLVLDPTEFKEPWAAAIRAKLKGE